MQNLSWKKLSLLASALLFLAYPLIIFFGLQILEPRYIAALLAIILLIRWRQNMHRVLNTLSKFHFVLLALLLMLISVTFIANSEDLLRIYPAAMSLGMLLLFGLSLIKPPSMVEIFARASTPELSPPAIAYTRKVTQVWCIFFLINSLIALYTALYTSREIWAYYNGLIVYIIMGLLFTGEWLLRRRFTARTSIDITKI